MMINYDIKKVEESRAAYYEYVDEKLDFRDAKQIEEEKEKLQYNIENEKYFLDIINGKVSALFAVTAIIQAIIISIFEKYISDLTNFNMDNKLLKYILICYGIYLAILVLVYIISFFSIRKPLLEDCFNNNLEYKNDEYDDSEKKILKGYYDDYIVLEEARKYYSNILSGLNFFLSSLVCFTIYIMANIVFSDMEYNCLKDGVLLISGLLALFFLFTSVVAINFIIICKICIIWYKKKQKSMKKLCK